MLSNKEIYFTIETNLQSVLGFTYSRIEDEEYDNVLNSVVSKELDNIRDKQRTTLEDKIISEIETIETYEFNKRGKEKEVAVDYNHINSSSSIIINTKCTGTAIKNVKKGEYYFAKDQAKYQDRWVDFFIGKDNPSIYGNAIVALTKEKQNIVLNSTEYSLYKTRNTYSPIVTIQDSKLKVFSKDYEIIQLIVNRNKDLKSILINGCENKTLNFSEDIQLHFIDLVVKRLSIRINQDQNKINNLNNEQ